MDFGNRLKTLRTQKKMKTIELAEKLKISDSTYRRYERNEIAPDLNIINKIAEIYDLTLADLLSEEKIIFSNNQNGGTSNNALIINQLSEKVIEQYELRINEKDQVINQLTKLIDKFA
jgi:transcriptional regulator with XRE-family HTH domain